MIKKSSLGVQELNDQSVMAAEAPNITTNKTQLQIMNAFAVNMISISDDIELVWYVARELVSKLGFDDCVVYLIDKDRDLLCQRAAIGKKNPVDNVIVNPMEIPLGEGVTGRVAASQKAVNLSDLDNCDYYISDIEGAVSEICVPILCEDHLYGVIDCEDIRRNHFKQEHMDLLTFIAALTAAKLQLIQKSRELVESEKRNRLIFNASLDGIITIDVRGNLVECNHAARKMFGFGRNELTGRKFTDLLVPPGFQNRFNEWFDKLSKVAGHRILDTRVETIAQRSNGVEFPVELTVTEYKIEEERFFTGFLRDISAQKQAEASRRKALVEAEKANKTKSEFLATMSHELRTPLNAIIGFSEVLNSQIFGPLGSARYEEYTNDILTSGRHLLNLVNDILDLSAIEANELSLSKKGFFIKDIVIECSAIISGLAQKKNIKYIEDVAEGLSALNADGRAVSQILINLLSNAVKFTPEGGQILLKVSEVGAYHVIKIEDTGHGFPPDKIESLIKPFVRGEDDVLKAQEGTGLGLAIVKSLVDMHEGELVIDSEVGRGTKVIVTLPNGS